MRGGWKTYWIVEYDKNHILALWFESEDTQVYTFTDTVNVGIYEELAIDWHITQYISCEH